MLQISSGTTRPKKKRGEKKEKRKREKTDILLSRLPLSLSSLVFFTVPDYETQRVIEVFQTVEPGRCKR